MELLFLITLVLLSISVVPQVNAIFSLSEAEAFSLRAVKVNGFGIHKYRGGSVEKNNNNEDDEDDDNNNMLYKNEEEVYYRDSEIPPIPSISYADFNAQAQQAVSTSNEENEKPTVLFILMDSFSPYHGQYLSNLARERYGVHIVNVLSGYIVNGLILSRKFVQENDNDDDENEGKNNNIMNLTIPIQMRAPYKGKETTEWFAKLCKQFDEGAGLDIAGIYCESDSGLLSAERLGKELNIKQHNGINHARRDKFLMNQAVSSYSKTKMRTVQQKRCVTLEDALTFASEKLGVIGEEENDETKKKKKKKKKYCIVKPFRGVASENVFLCDSLEKVQKAFQEIDQNPLFGEGPPEEEKEENGNDVSSVEKLAKVLIQEFAQGEEYAIDIVSKNGEHKIAALWKYDKRPVGEHAFVYHATQLCQDIYYPPPDDNKLFNDVVNLEKLAVMEYAMDSLNAVGVKWGLSHVEVKINVKPDKHYVTMKDYYEDCTLIEVNCR